MTLVSNSSKNMQYFLVSKRKSARYIFVLNISLQFKMYVRTYNEITCLFILVLLLTSYIENTRHSYCYVCIFCLDAKQNKGV